MADVNSTQYARRVSTPFTNNEPGEHGGRVRRAVAEAALTSGNPASGEYINLFYLPKGAFIQDIWVFSDGVTSLSDEDIGDANDQDALMDGLDLSSAAHLKASDAEQGSNGYDITTESDQPLWQLLGYSTAADAPQEVLIRIESSGSGGSGTVSVVVTYVVD